MKSYRKFFASFVWLGLIVVFCMPANSEEHKSSTINDIRSFFTLGADIAVFGDVDIKDARAAVDVWVREIGEEAGLKTETHVYKDIGLLAKDIQNGKLDVGSTTPLKHLGIRQNIDVEVMFGALKRGKKTQKYLLLVHSDSAFNNVKDLDAKKLAVMRRDEVGLLYLNTLLLQDKQRETGKFFSTIIKKRKWSQAILAVFFKQADVCIATDTVFNTMVELNPQVGKQLRAIAVSPEIVTNITFIRKGCDQKKKKIFQDKVLTLEETSRGRQILMLFQTDRLALLEESELNTLKALVDKYNKLKGEI